MSPRRIATLSSAVALLLAAGTLALVTRQGDNGTRVRTEAPEKVSSESLPPTTAVTTSLLPDLATTTAPAAAAPTSAKPVTTSLPPTTIAPPRRLTTIPMAMPLDVVRGSGGRGWIVGVTRTNGVVARTEDAGATWEWVCFGGWSATAASFLDDQRGFVASGRVGGGAAQLWRTGDGGRTFTTKPIDLALQGITSVHFLDERIGWIIGTAAAPGAIGDGMIAATSDGGATWKMSTFPGLVIDGLWAQGGRTLATASRFGSPPVILQASPDGSWTRTEVPGLESLRSITQVGGRLVAVGASRPNADALPEGPSVAASEDGGATWHVIEASPSANFWDVSAGPRGELWAVGQLGGGAGVASSVDEGRTWTVLPRMQNNGGAYLEVAVGADDVWALGYQPGLAIGSTGADRSWRSVQLHDTELC